jgi:hypothetical protein
MLKIMIDLGIECQHYLHLSRDGRDLPGVGSSSENNLSYANDWILFIAASLYQAIRTAGDSQL